MAVTTTRRRKLQNKMRKKSLIKTYGTFLEGLTHLSNKCRKKMIQESPKEVIDCVGGMLHQSYKRQCTSDKCSKESVTC